MIAYLLKVTLCWLFFYGVYELFLKNKTFFTANRSYLLTTLAVGLLLPLLELVPWKNETNVAYVIYPVLMEIDELQFVAQGQQESSFNFWNLIYIGYGIGFIVAFSRLLFGISKIVTLYKGAQKTKYNGYTIALTNQYHLPFSFFKYVFFSDKVKLNDEADKILAHEVEHIKGGHSIDILLAEVLKVVFWCSPMIYLYKNALKEIHEYLADQVVIKKSDKKTYKRLLLEQTNNGLQMALTHQFFNSHLKNRIKMINQKRSGRPTLVMYALGIPVLLILGLAFTFTFQDDVPEQDVPAIMERTDGHVMDEMVIVAFREAEAESTADQQSQSEAETLSWNETLARKVYNQIAQERLSSIDTVPKANSETDGSTVPMEIFKVVEEMPRFPGCEDMEGGSKEKEDCAKHKMLEYIYTTLKYPSEDRKAGIEGMAVAQFIINDKGAIDNVKIVRSISKNSDAEVIRVLENMNNLPENWTPGYQRGKAVNVLYTLPVRFKLEDDEGEKVKEVLEEEVEDKQASNDVRQLLNSRDVLVVVDGVELDVEEEFEMNPDDIATINVLKGASAKDAYGEKGVNGVVEITTKKAQKIVVEEVKIDPVVYLDGVKYEGEITDIDKDDIATINVLKGEKAFVKYGKEAENGVIEIITKKASKIAYDYDTPAYFQGCDDYTDPKEKALCSQKMTMSYLFSNLKYPKKAAESGLEGKVLVKMRIDKNGKIRGINIKEGHPDLANAAMDVINKMGTETTWEPAMKDGKAVAMEMVIPMNFKLPSKDESVEAIYTKCELITDKSEREECIKQAKIAVEKTFSDLKLTEDSKMRSLELEKVEVFPNPARSFINVKFKAEAKPLTMQLLDVDGKMVFSKNYSSFKGNFNEQIPIEQAQGRLLLMRIIQDDKLFTEKIIIE